MHRGYGYRERKRPLSSSRPEKSLFCLVLSQTRSLSLFLAKAVSVCPPSYEGFNKKYQTQLEAPLEKK